MSHRKPPLPPHYGTVTPGVCRWCNQPVTVDGSPTNGTWHPACVTEYKLLHWPAETRRAVFARDRGICARCGVDGERAKRRFERANQLAIGPDYLRWALPPWTGRTYGVDYAAAKEACMQRYYRMEVRYRKRQAKLRQAAANRVMAMGRVGSGWQHDHIRPLVEAHGDISFWQLDNIQTLCTACHVAKGAEDNRRRKSTREQAAQPLLITAL